MSSKLVITLATLGLLAAVALFVVSATLDSAVKQAVNRLAPSITGTTVTLDDVSLSPLSGSGTLSGLFIGNPAGWSGDKLAYLGRIHVDVAPTSLLGDTIVIHDIVIEQPEFVYETRLVTSNIKQLLQQIEDNTGGGSSKVAPAAGEPPGEPKKLAVQRFILRDAKVTVGVGPAAVTVPMPDLELNDLGTPENGLTSSQLAFAVSREVLNDIITAVTTGVANGTINLNKASDGEKKVGNTLRGLLGGAQDPDGD